MAITQLGKCVNLKSLNLKRAHSAGFLYRSLGFPPATGLEADKVGVLLLERLYKTDHSDDFDREGFLYRALGFPPATGLEAGKVGVLLLEWLYKTDHSDYFDQEMEGYVRAEVASDTLVALSRNHFSLVMYELQHHLKPLNLTEESVIVTLAKLANGNARSYPKELMQFFLSQMEMSKEAVRVGTLALIGAVVLMSSPYKREGCRIAMLNLLKTLSQSIDPSTADMKELKILMLVKYLEEHTEFTWNQKSWEDKLIQFLRNSLKMT
ncbi:unnamed protein product [Rangifer tarandus platyrhynchus]|uniref:Uncharacterized protein n=1 Tax=Rangifer tarandus platyrhynchus TaxID=3082113 RepID=A0ABN8XSR5_RANTA|nr:unnamed protein product [Rangifer tarandus platyrhynchus]